MLTKSTKTHRMIKRQASEFPPFSHTHAEDFINHCLPKEIKDRFFIIDLDELENCEDADKIQKVTGLYAKVI